jgi:hypothetical protein
MEIKNIKETAAAAATTGGVSGSVKIRKHAVAAFGFIRVITKLRTLNSLIRSVFSFNVRH